MNDNAPVLSKHQPETRWTITIKTREGTKTTEARTMAGAHGIIKLCAQAGHQFTVKKVTT